MASWKKVLVSGSAAQLASLTLDTALPVAQGGIGASSLTDKAVLISQDSGTDAIGAVALTSNGQLIIGGSDGPAAATLTGTSNEITVTNGANSITLSLPDDVTIGGDLTITDDVTSLVDINDMRDIVKSRNITNSGSIADSHITGSFTGSFTGDGSGLTGTGLDVDTLSDYGAQTLHQTQDNFLVSDNGTEKKIKFSDLEDSIFANISGDATVAGGGALTIAADSVSNSMLENMTQGTVKVGGGSNAPTDLDAKTDGQILVGDGTDINSVAVSGDVALANNGAVTIQANAVEGSMLNSNVAGTGLDYGSNELSVDVSDFMTNGSNNRVLTATGTDGQNAEANLTFDGSTLVVNGNLEVAGTQTTVNSTNLLIEDRFILLNSGSTASGDGGFLVGSGSAYSASAFVFDDSEDRWGVQIDTQLGSTAATSIPEAYSSLLVLNAHTGSSTYTKNGNMRINDDGDIFIYVE
jgi:hypothetical protein